MAAHKLADVCLVLAQQLRGRLAIQHFLKSAKPQDIFFLKTERPLMPLDDKLRRKLTLPACIDVSILDDKIIDVEMVAKAFDLGKQSFTSDFGHADEELEGAFDDPPASPCAKTVGAGDVFFSISHKFPEKICDVLASTDIVIHQWHAQ